MRRACEGSGDAWEYGLCDEGVAVLSYSRPSGLVV